MLGMNERRPAEDLLCFGFGGFFCFAGFGEADTGVGFAGDTGVGLGGAGFGGVATGAGEAAVGCGGVSAAAAIAGSLDSSCSSIGSIRSSLESEGTESPVGCGLSGTGDDITSSKRSSRSVLDGWVSRSSLRVN